jgi:hypothetical protein
MKTKSLLLNFRWSGKFEGLLAMHYNDDCIVIQSLELPREVPVRPSAAEAVKVPLQPLQGSGDWAKRDKQSSFPKIPKTFLISPKLFIKKSLRICAGS